jgi:beta-galactosidase
MKLRMVARHGFATFIVLVLVHIVGWGATAQWSKAASLLTIDARSPVAPPETDYLEMGSTAAATSPTGRTLSVNSRYLVLDGKPWLPVMGEFHFTRYPERYWEEEILKMKAGGVQIVATYVFWIHQEEVEGQFDWSGRRNLREFVELCGKHGMYVYPRIGPWAHGEVRNGGLPDWLLKKGPVRVNDRAYLSYVRQYYDQIGQQLKGLLWKQGGPVIGIQLENEYSDRSASGGAAHISELKRLAMAAGLDVPLYTVTGWDNAVYPPRQVIPVFGGYPDDFWSGSLQEAPPDVEGTYQFHVSPAPADTGILQGASGQSKQPQLWHYPRFTAELGGGMAVAYHRRPVIYADDIAPTALVQLGSGINLLGYYMFQGGTNPEGKLTTLQESQATGYSNDLPVKSYDFQAPLREFGQMNGSFRPLKVIHQFVADFGSYLAPMTASLPETGAGGKQSATALRVAARTAGNHGFIFFNNYLRNYPLPKQRDVQVLLKLPSETITVPRSPVNIPSQSCFFWPVNLDLGGTLLKYATAQLFARMDDKKIAYYFFVASPGIATEFVFDAPTISSVTARTGNISRQGGRTYVEGVTPSTGVALQLHTHSGKRVRIVLLSEQQAENSWKISVGGQAHMLMTLADLFSDDDTIHLRSRNADGLSFSIFPKLDKRARATVPLQKGVSEGIFAHYILRVKPSHPQIKIEPVRDAAPSSPVKLGRYWEWRHSAVAAAPDDKDFEKAAIWRLTFPNTTLQGLSDIFLDIDYVGDAGRLYEGSRLLDDNFYNGTAWEIGLKRYAPQVWDKGLELKILPLRKDAPIYIPKAAWPDFGGKSEIVKAGSISLQAEYEVELNLAGPAR